MASKLLQQYEDEVRALEAEVHVLSQQCDDAQPCLPVTGANAPPNLDVPPANLADLSVELQQLETDLANLEELCGIGFTEFSKRMLRRDGPRRTYKYRISGACGPLPFQLEFQLLEVQGEEATSSAVTELLIVMESGEWPELSKFVSHVEDRKSLLLFFRTLSAFSEWCEYRKSTFQHFKGRYADFIRLPEGSSAQHMVIRTPELTGCELIVVWKIHVNEEGAVTPVLDLLTKVPKQALQLDVKKVVQHAPANFRTMLKVYGIEAALEHLIKAFAMLD